MALRAKWTIRVDRLPTRLALGTGEHAHEPMLVSLEVEGLAAESPAGLGDCLDYATVCDWITEHWPRSPAVPLMETRVNELLRFLFAYDKRVQSAWVGLYRPTPSGNAQVGVERRASRSQFQTRLRAAES